MLNSTSRKFWIYGLWGVFVVHDVEEVLTISTFAGGHLSQFPPLLQSIFLSGRGISTLEMAAAVSLLVLLMLGLLLQIDAHPDSMGWQTLWGLIAAILFANGITHIAQGLVLKTYTPGLITGSFLELPAAGLCLAWMRRHNALSIKKMAGWVLLGFPLEGILAAGAILLGKFLTRVL